MRSSCGLLVTPTCGLLPPGELDYVVVVGGLLRHGTALDPAARAYLRRAAAVGTTLIGVCTGSFLLCREGLMEGRRACVSWFHYQDFKDEFPDQDAVADRLFLVDRDRITCSGGSNVAARRRRRRRSTSCCSAASAAPTTRSRIRRLPARAPRPTRRCIAPC